MLISPEQYKKVQVGYTNRLSQLNEKTYALFNLIDGLPLGSALRVLIVGCGEHPIEIESLEGFLNAKQIKIEFYAVEINKEMVAKCQKKYADKTNVRFIAADAADYQTIYNFTGGKQVDMIIARHPVLNSGRSNIAGPFRHFFTETVPRLLKTGGNLLVSIFTGHEADDCRKLLSVITQAGYIELNEEEGVYWESEKFLVQYGLDNVRGKAVDLYAEKYFFAIVGYQPQLLLQLEHQYSTNHSENEYAQKLTNRILEIMNSTVKQKTFYPIHTGNLFNYLLNHVIEFFSQETFTNSKDFLEEILNALAKFEQTIKLIEPEQFSKLVKDNLKSSEWVYSHWDLHPGQQKKFIEQICSALLLVAQHTINVALDSKNNPFQNSVEIITQRHLYDRPSEESQQPQIMESKPLNYSNYRF